jgi:predicted RNase H-like HicB family nuclease
VVEGKSAVEAGWMILRDPSGRATVGHVLLTFSVVEVEGVFTSCCPELDVHSYGKTITDALDSIQDATIVYLNAIEQRDLREKVFHEADIAFQLGAPVTLEARPVSMRAGEIKAAFSVGLVESGV